MFVILYIVFVHGLEVRKPDILNNKGADQPAHPRRLISALVFRFLGKNYIILILVKLNFLASLLAEKTDFYNH